MGRRAFGRGTSRNVCGGRGERVAGGGERGRAHLASGARMFHVKHSVSQRVRCESGRMPRGSKPRGMLERGGT